MDLLENRDLQNAAELWYIDGAKIYVSEYFLNGESRNLDIGHVTQHLDIQF